MEVQRKFSKICSGYDTDGRRQYEPGGNHYHGSDVQDGELSWIKNYCAGIIPEKHMVNISIDGEYEETYSKGLIKSALNRLLFPVSEV